MWTHVCACGDICDRDIFPTDGDNCKYFFSFIFFLRTDFTDVKAQSKKLKKSTIIFYNS